MKKLFAWIFILGILGGIGWIAWKFYRTQTAVSAETFNLIPSDAIYCLVMASPIDSWKELAGSQTWTHLQQSRYFAELTSSANSLDSLVQENDILADLIGSRALIISAHMTAPKDYDFLFMVDLQEVAGITFLNEYLTDFTTSGFSMRKEKYGTDDVIILYNPDDKSNLYLSVPGKYLLASYSKKILTSALRQHQDSTSTNETFLEPVNSLEMNPLMQVYVNYTLLPKFVGCYSNGNEYVNQLAKALETTSLTVTLKDELIKATGRTMVNDSVESYLKTLSVSGKGPTEFLEIAPQRTAFCLGLGFTSLQEFFTNFETNVKQDVQEYESYRANLKQVEDYLNIDLQENFIKWVGDEIAVLELQSSGKGLDNEMALVLKAADIEQAKKDLAYIEKMVRKRTPVKFKEIDHRGYTISYLSMKGLFKVLLGKFFARYDKPYYTILNNFVIFSNHPQTLESIIDDYLEKKTLVKSEEFREFRKEFNDEGSVFVYLNTPILFNTMKSLADVSTQTDMNTNKEFIVCFRHVGFQLTPDAGEFNTIFAEKFVGSTVTEETAAAAAAAAAEEEEEEEEEIESSETPEPEDEPTEEKTSSPKESSDPMELPYIYVKDLNAPNYREFYPDKELYFEVELRNGFKNGFYTEYHPNGKIKMTGHFKQDKRDGTWRLYNESSKLILKRVYDNGEITKERSKE